MNKLTNAIKASLDVERRGLESINVPVKRIPDAVAQDIATRVLLSSLQKEYAERLLTDACFLRLIKAFFNDKDRG